MIPENFTISREIFLNLLIICYFIAFSSLAVQAKGLYGSKGIEPIRELLKLYKEGLGKHCYSKLPTLFWLNSSDSMIVGAAFGGTLISLIALIGFSQPFFLFALWFLYLSYVSVGREFLSYQWDVLLLEVGFMAIFFAMGDAPSLFLLIAAWFLLFRLMFSSGVVKLMSGDPHWRGLTALDYHFESQPLPTRAAWWMHQLPGSIKKWMTALVLLIEIVIPFGIFGPPEIRFWCAGVLILLQIVIFVTGNYCFFNLLTVALCMTALDNTVFGYPPISESVESFILNTVGMLIIFFNTLQLIRFTYRPLWMHKTLVWASQYHISGGYGLFAVMTTKRREIVIEGSRDGIEWKAYKLRWKPHELDAAPKQAAPYQPRLDWQFWFASLSNYSREQWLHRYLEQILRGSKEVLRLIETNPFPEHPPKWVRAQIYDYRFTTFEERKATGNWWKREYLGNYSTAIRLKDPI